MKALTGLIIALSIPLMILNMLGGIVAGIWLAILGDCSIGAGILIFFVSTGILGFVIMPSILLAVPAALCAERWDVHPARWLGVAKKKRPIISDRTALRQWGEQSFRDPRSACAAVRIWDLARLLDPPNQK